MNITRLTYPRTGFIQYFVNSVVDNTTVRNDIFSGNTTKLATSLDPVETPVIFSFSSKLLNGGVSVRSEVYIDFTTNPDFILDFFTTQFTTANSNLTANQFYSAASGFTLQERIDSLVLAINSNLNLNWRYTATNYLNQYVKIVANQPGTTFNLTTPNIISTPNYLTSYTAGLDSDRGMQLQNYNYKCFVEVWTMDVEWNRFGFSSDPALGNRLKTLVATLSQTWTSSNQFVFDVSKYLNTIVLELNQYLNLSSQFAFKDQTKCYYLKWGESFIGCYDPDTDLPVDTPWNITNNFVTKRYIGETELRWASQGVYQLADVNNNHPHYWMNEYYSLTTNQNEQNPIKTLTTFDEEYKLIRRQPEPEFLSYYVYNDQSVSSTFQLRLRHNWTAWNGLTSQTYTSTTFCNRNGFYTVNVQPDLIGISAVEATLGSPIHFYTTTLEWNTNVVWVDYTTPVMYQVDLNTEKVSTYTQVYWVNELGAIDTWTFEGLIETETNHSYDTYTKTIKGIDNERYKHITGIITKRNTTRRKFNSGFLTSEQLQPLQSMLNSNQVWMVQTTPYSAVISNVRTDRTETYYQSVNIIDHNYLTASRPDLFNLEVTIEVAIKQNSQY